MKIETQITIAAAPEKVWKVLTDFNHYPEWNPFIKSVKGIVEVGKTIQITLPDMKFTPKILIFEKNRELKWLGKLLFKGLFDGEHQFYLKELPNGDTLFLHSEHFSGLLVPFFKKKLQTNTTMGFQAMNQQLKIRSES